MSPPAVVGLRPILVTGGAGFIGSNLVDRLAREGEHVLILDDLSRAGVDRNVAWLQARHGDRVSLLVGDVRDGSTIAGVVKQASAIFHFAAQVAVTTSLREPVEDFAINVAATLGLLEAVRLRGGDIPVIFASTNKVYGDLADLPLAVRDDAYLPADDILRGRGISEQQPLDFHTPYGCSKGAAEQYVLDYARSFGLPAAVMRMSCIYGPRQMGTEDQGWVAHFMLRILAGEPISIYGDGRQVRDVLFVDDAVEAYIRAWRAAARIAGRAFNLGGGPLNAVSLRQVLAHAEQLLGCRAELSFHPTRAGDQRYYVSDIRRVTRELALPPPLAWQAGLARLAQWLRDEHGIRPSPATPVLQTAGA
ncbi:SDR family NAD(P)-dependent oxidoreductase [Chelatococcus reniformis]|uniref:CDP-paratose 2-epimerase n=1 Tax=Chelatococcus reniformis TaxID=1494448 RepID=A0A916UN54_9HYPH|nr:SDR family NAD(P)-dependent oxidoreductase [Chelatococcus reniformis]GGC78581.1 CDP-paratose 2-epimerase [Chelatococcus reniformis]